jgi:DNA polymerase elongation subunit (family B)
LSVAHKVNSDGSIKKRLVIDNDYALTIDTFIKVGFTIALDKSDKVGDSSQCKEYLGFVIDTRDMTVHVPELKMARITALLKEFLASKTHLYKVRDVASMV